MIKDFQTIKSEFFSKTLLISKKNLLFFANLFEKTDTVKEIQDESEVITKEVLVDHLSHLLSLKSSIEHNLQQLIRVFRNKHPRIAFFSDDELLEISMKIDKPKELLKNLTDCFPGVKSFDFEIRTGRNSIQNILEIVGFETKINEKLYLRQSVKVENFNKYDLYFLDLIARLEESLKDFLLNNIFKSLQSLYKYSLDYISLFKSLTNKQTCFQALFLINDILFFYELTHMLKLCDRTGWNCEKELQNLKIKILESLSNFRSFFQNTAIKGLNHMYSQFSLQILSHVCICDFLINSRLQEIASFEFLILPKFSLQVPKSLLKSSISETVQETLDSIQKPFDENIENYSAKSSFFANCLKNPFPEMKISLIMMNYRLDYGFEIARKFQVSFPNEISFRPIISLASSLASFQGLVVRGESSTGRKTSIETIGALLARPLFFIGIHLINMLLL